MKSTGTTKSTFQFYGNLHFVGCSAHCFILLHVQAIGSGASPVQNPRQAAYEGRVQAMNYSTNSSNKEAAEALKAMLVQINC